MDRTATLRRHRITFSNIGKLNVEDGPKAVPLSCSARSFWFIPVPSCTHDKYTFMNFEVNSAAKPYHTRAAKAGGASGLAQVEILIDTNGSVLTARARTGNKLLHPEAERAALQSKFYRPEVYGKPARAIGFLVYRFGESREE